MRRLLTVVAAALCAAGPAVASTSQDWWAHDVGADLVAAPGPGIPIAIVDSGVDPSHPAFAGRPNTTFLNDQTVTGVEEYHGTAVASVATSVYPQAALESWDASPVSAIMDFSAANGITTVADRCPAVINLSFGGTNPDPPLEDAILYAVHNGCLVVAAAGNNGQSGNPVTYPASYPHVLTVGASNQNDQYAPFSTAAVGIDLCAPGAGMVAAVPLAHDPTGYSSGLAGTSFSASIVSAAAAWIWTARPALDASQVAGVLRGAARDIGSLGYDLQCGFGILDIPAALTTTAPPRDPLEPNDDVDQVKPAEQFDDGQPQITTAAKPSLRIAGSLDQSEDPRDLYRIWVPAHRVARARVSAGGAAAARIWGPQTTSVLEGVDLRRRDLKGPLIRAGAKGLMAYVEVLLTGSSPSARYVLSVTASKR